MLRTEADYTRHSWLLGMEAFDTIRSYSDQAVHVVRTAMREVGLQLYTDSPSSLNWNCGFKVQIASVSMPALNLTYGTCQIRPRSHLSGDTQASRLTTAAKRPSCMATGIMPTSALMDGLVRW
jgi:hypothetical protein